jgi:hypothetical protein
MKIKLNKEDSNALTQFIELSKELIEELEAERKGVPEGKDPKGYHNTDIALKNIKTWHDLAVSGELPNSYYPNFGLSKSDLMFGKAEERMYQLENLYVKHFLKYFDKNKLKNNNGV